VHELFRILQIPTTIFKGIFKKFFNTNIGDILIASGFIEYSLVNIGDHSIIGSYSEIIGHVIEGDKIYIKKVKIGNNCTIGAQTIIMPGVEIGDNTIVGACSLVPKNKKLEPNSVYAGVPVRKIKNLRP
jgi:acetyltransferase-like isoleucine patch superfamily enzyme